MTMRSESTNPRFYRLDPGHHIAPRTGTGVADDRALVLVAEVVAAAVVRLEDDPSLRGKQLREEAE